MTRSWPLGGIAGGVVGLMIVGLAAFASPGNADAITNCSTNSAALDAMEQEMLRLHNETRAQHGLGPLTASPTLNRAAAWKSADSSASGSSFGHIDSLGRSPSQRAQDCGYPSGAGENIAYGYSSAQATFNAWMNSPGHRANILGSDYRAIGIGAEGNRWTVKFGFVVDSEPVEPPTSTPVPNTPTNTPAPATPTNTPVPNTPTNTPAPATPTNTPAPEPTSTPTTTPVESEPTRAAELPQPWANLLPGLNLITFAGNTTDVRRGLADIDGEVLYVYHFDQVEGQWSRYIPGAPTYVNSLHSLRHGEPYFIGIE